MMGGVNDRVKEFLTTWKRRKTMRVEGKIDGDPDHIELYCDCGTLLVDGNFVLVDGTLRCLSCQEKLTQQTQ